MNTFLAAVERAWRHAVVYPVLRRIFRNPPVVLPLNVKSVQRLLILRYDRLGDMIMTSWICRTLHELHPDVRVGIVASPANASIARLLPGVDEIYVVGGSIWRTLREIGRARSDAYDLVLNFIFNRTTSAGILANLMGPRAVKVGQGDEKYRFYFNALLTLRKGTAHMAEILEQLCADVFGKSWRVRDMRLELREVSENARPVTSFLGADSGSCVVVNLSAGRPFRYPSSEQVDAVIRSANAAGRPVVLTSAPGDGALMDATILRNPGSSVRRFPVQGTVQFELIIELVRRASVLVTPDTSLVHVAAAVGCPVVALYTSRLENHEWLPWRVRNEVVISIGNQPVASIAPAEIVAALERIMRELKKEGAL